MKKLLSISTAIAAAAMLHIQPIKAADLGEISAMSGEGASDSPSESKTFSGSSSSSGSTRKMFSLTWTTLMMGPALDKSATAVPAPAPGQPRRSGHRRPRDTDPAASADTSNERGGGGGSYGYSLKHMMGADFRVSDNMRVGPVLDFSEPFYGPGNGKLLINDPQFKLHIENPIRSHIGSNPVTSNATVTYYYPASSKSQALHVMSGVGLSFGPRVRFAHSRFSMASMFSSKMTIADHPGNGLNTPTRFQIGLQTTYQASRVAAPFVMPYWSGSAGPKLPFAESDPSSIESDSSGGKRGPFGVILGSQLRASQRISVTPRLNWYTAQPLGATTFGINAVIKLI